MDSHLEESLSAILLQYQTSFNNKVFANETDEYDLLMNVFSLTPKIKRKYGQYWGTQLGRCWQKIITEICKNSCQDFQPVLKIKDVGELCDLRVGKYAIDTQYRIGSGDKGTHDKFRYYGNLLTEMGYTPTILILRNDNLPDAINACKGGQWQVFTEQDSMDFIQRISGVDVKTFLENQAGKYTVSRNLI